MTRKLVEILNPSAPSGSKAMARLRDLIDLDGRPRAQVAAACDPPMSPAQLSQLYTGHRPKPELGTVARILAALGRTWADLDGG